MKMREMLAENRAMIEKSRALMEKIRNDLKRPPGKHEPKI